MPVGSVLQQIQRVLQQQPRLGPLVSIGRPTVLTGGSATVSSASIQSPRQPPAKSPYSYIGYYEGSQQAKIWLVVPEDLKKMYKYTQGGAITLWCDGRCDDDNENARKRKRNVETNKKHCIEENKRHVDEVYKKLLDKHGST